MPAHITFTPIDVAEVSDALGALTRDCSPLGPLAILHLFKASTVSHKRETVVKIRHGNGIISKVFGLHCLINLDLKYLLWCSFSGQSDVNKKNPVSLGTHVIRH